MAKKLTPEEDKIRVASMWQLENEKTTLGFRSIAGIDEAGRGPLAGPVYAAAVILPPRLYIEGINDSKKLSAKKREELYEIICQNALSYHISSVNEKIIDKINILNATYLAMNDALSHLKIPADFALIDGNRAKDVPVPFETIIKGDSKSISIAAASILAKVARDHFITEQAALYPEYGFAKHKGYGTAEHMAALREFGPCPIHRKTFLKNLM